MTGPPNPPASPPSFSVGLVFRIIVRAVSRFMGRDIMLFAGGVSYFGLLAVFPALIVGVAVYGALTSPAEAEAQVAALARILPTDANTLVMGQLQRVSQSPISVLSGQGLIALFVAAYGSTRGVKALIAGLNRISEDEDVRNVFHFNMFAAGVTLLAVVGIFAANAVALAVRIAVNRLSITLGDTERLASSQWIWAALGMFAGVMLLYRYAMARSRVRWRACSIAASIATGAWLTATWFLSNYAVNMAAISATYGSLGAVVVLLIWIYLTAYSVFFGAALALEIQAAIEPELEDAIAT